MKTNRFMLFNAKGDFTGVSDSNFNNLIDYVNEKDEILLVSEFIGFNTEIVRYIHNPNDIMLNYVNHPKVLEAIDKFNIKPNHMPMFELIPELNFN